MRLRINFVYLRFCLFLRISSRKANKLLKEQIITWMNELDNKDYYNNLYLEDIILSVKNIDKE